MAGYEYDLIVIGAGSGGVRAARMSASFGAKVAIVEKQYLGGTCVNVGCVPKKLFVYASHFSEDFQNSVRFGWSEVNSEFYWPTLLRNKNSEIARLNDVYENLLNNAGVDRYDGKAEIMDGHTVRVGEQLISSEKILIATGGHPVKPDFLGSEHVITSDDAFFLDRLPSRCLIIGGGYIAVEFAGILNGLGVQTKLSYRGGLFLKDFDIDIRVTVKEELSKKGIGLKFESEVESIQKDPEFGFKVRFVSGEILETDLILSAIGRVPAVADMGLENLDLGRKKNGAIEVDEHFRTTEQSVFALGDVTDRYQLTPVALEEAMCFSSTQFGGKTKLMSYENIPTAIFCQPNAATVGLTEAQAREKYKDIEIYIERFRPMKHTISGSDEKYMMKLIVHKSSDKILGVHMVGADAGEIIQGLAVAMKMGVTKSVFDATVGIHPTTAEEFVTMRNVSRN